MSWDDEKARKMRDRAIDELELPANWNAVASRIDRYRVRGVHVKSTRVQIWDTMTRRALSARIANATRRMNVSRPRPRRIAAAARRNKAERYTCTLLNNATAVLSIHVAIRTWTLDVARL